jgi:MFS family permease
MATTLQQFSAIVGPATGGLIIARYGVAPAYLFHIVIVLVGLACLAGMRIPPRTEPRGALSLALIKEGLAYIRAHPAVLGAMVLDMFAVIFAGAEALLPIFARDILDVGAFGYGLLTASKGVGAFMMAVALALLPPRVSTGRIMIVTVTLYGLFTIVFGLSTWFPLSLVAYGLIAMSDQLSVVIRQTIIQLETPDALRGRVSSVNSLFVGASNQLGAVESGLMATWTGSAAVAVVSGGLGCLASVAIISVLIPSLWRHRVHLEAPAVEQPVRSG